MPTVTEGDSLKDHFFNMLNSSTQLLSDGDFQTKLGLLMESTEDAHNTFPTIAFTDTSNPDQPIIYLNSDFIPEKYQKYIVLHETWETYLWLRSSDHMYQKALADSQLPEDGQVRLFHRIAILNELKTADNDDILEEYNNWVNETYEGLRESNGNANTRKIIDSMQAMRSEVLTKYLSSKSRISNQL